MAFDLITPTRLGGGELATLPATTTLRTTPTDSKDIVTGINVANNNAATQSVTLWLVPSGGTADSTNILIPDVIISGNTLLQWRGSQVLDAGATIVAGATSSGISIIISGGNGV